MPLNIGVLAPKSSWHFQDLQRAAQKVGDISLCPVDFSTLSATVDPAETFSDALNPIDSLDALWVRTMPRGSLQQVVFRMDVLHRLSASGVSVINSPRSVEIAIDKYLSLSLMAAAGIAVPPFAVCQTVDQGLQAWERLGGDVVLKPIFGSMGRNVHRLRDKARAVQRLEEFVSCGEVLYLQKYIAAGGRDIRILVVGESIFAMQRKNTSGWLTNVAQGGVASAHTATLREIEIARWAARINGCQIAGVDIIYEADSADPMVLEVNASPGWEAIQKVCEQDVARTVLTVLTQKMQTQPAEN